MFPLLSSPLFRLLRCDLSRMFLTEITMTLTKVVKPVSDQQSNAEEGLSREQIRVKMEAIVARGQELV